MTFKLSSEGNRLQIIINWPNYFASQQC